MDKDIIPQYKHSKIGNLMFQIGAKWTKLMIKCRVFYYFISIFWNTIMFIVGLLCTLALWIASWFNKSIKFEKYYWIYCVKVGQDYWGGFDTALMFVRDKKSTPQFLNTHEWGHSLSQSWLGPLFPFVVAIPSASRWWYRQLNKGKVRTLYDAVWFEDLATVAGKWAVEYLENKKTTKK